MRSLAVLLVAVTLSAGAIGCENLGGGWHSAAGNGAAGCNCGAHASAAAGGTVVAQPAPVVSEPPMKME
jgi:hypothetical protein